MGARIAYELEMQPHICGICLTPSLPDIVLDILLFQYSRGAKKVDRRKFIVILAGLVTAFAISTNTILNWLRTTTNKLLPPSQRIIDKLRVLHVGNIPTFDEKTWTLEVYGLVENPFILNYNQFKQLPHVVSIADFHCVTGWSKLDNKWEGVRFTTLMEKAILQNEAKYATIECEQGYTTSLPIEDLIKEDVLLADRLDDEDLPPQYGGPLRLVVPHKYAYKSAKWIRKIRFTEEQELGYWETRGYSNTADPFTDDRYG
jgi:DMSO/TMAO reductase YedYZ molybdopterin-dependent catalytic subunit